MHSPTHIFIPFSYLFLKKKILSLSNSVWFWIHKTNSKRSFLIYVVVDVMERALTLDYSSNWDWNQLFLNISVICYLKMLISCYNILYRDIFQYFWAAVVAKVEALYCI